MANEITEGSDEMPEEQEAMFPESEHMYSGAELSDEIELGDDDTDLEADEDEEGEEGSPDDSGFDDTPSFSEKDWAGILKIAELAGRSPTDEDVKEYYSRKTEFQNMTDSKREEARLSTSDVPDDEFGAGIVGADDGEWVRPYPEPKAVDQPIEPAVVLYPTVDEKIFDAEAYDAAWYIWGEYDYLLGIWNAWQSYNALYDQWEIDWADPSAKISDTYHPPLWWYNETPYDSEGDALIELYKAYIGEDTVWVVGTTGYNSEANAQIAIESLYPITTFYENTVYEYSYCNGQLFSGDGVSVSAATEYRDTFITTQTGYFHDGNIYLDRTSAEDAVFAGHYEEITSTPEYTLWAYGAKSDYASYQNALDDWTTDKAAALAVVESTRPIGEEPSQPPTAPTYYCTREESSNSYADRWWSENPEWTTALAAYTQYANIDYPEWQAKDALYQAYLADLEWWKKNWIEI